MNTEMRVHQFCMDSLDANVKDVKDSNARISRSSFVLLPCKHLAGCIVTPLLNVSMCGRFYHEARLVPIGVIGYHVMAISLASIRKQSRKREKKEKHRK